MPPRNTDPNRPKGRTSAYAFFVKHQREKSKQEGITAEFSAFAKKCSDEWKELEDDEKGEFFRMAEVDKKRYDREMKSYVPPAGATKSGRGRKKKDPRAPKRPLSAFLFFCQDRRPDVKAKNPSFTIGTVAKVLGGEWKEIGDDKKRKYEEQAQKDRERYEQEKKDYAPVVEEEEEEDEEEYED